MSTDNTPTTESATAPGGADERDDVSAQLDEFREEIAELREENTRLRSNVEALETELSELRADVRGTEDDIETNQNLTNKAHERIRELESRQSSVSDATELEIALQQSDAVIKDRYSVAEQRALVMAHYVSNCGGPRGVRISDDTFQRSVEHELEESLAWAQLDRAADALASMAGDAIEHVSDGDGNRLSVNDESVLPD
ncbi:hypothetical protein PM023_13045 [Halorubrum ezzemoulense]|uniref:hypothetical protein n=1 Tax=Halorubrum ezzemoulense TaxID=337243 RepID=UPI00232AA02C|nr:hypothetical protein [Halorubrum ezzemoulense]MDB2225596.1 hypothetical protein [Halorubrum ezzemoulense]